MTVTGNVGNSCGAGKETVLNLNLMKNQEQKKPLGITNLPLVGEQIKSGVAANSKNVESAYTKYLIDNIYEPLFSDPYKYDLDPETVVRMRRHDYMPNNEPEKSRYTAPTDKSRYIAPTLPCIIPTLDIRG